MLRAQADALLQDVIDLYRARGIDMAMMGDGPFHRVCAAAPHGIEVAWLAINQKVIGHHIHESQVLNPADTYL
jgi:hypothetical protein